MNYGIRVTVGHSRMLNDIHEHNVHQSFDFYFAKTWY